MRQKRGDGKKATAPKMDLRVAQSRSKIGQLQQEVEIVAPSEVMPVHRGFQLME